MPTPKKPNLRQQLDLAKSEVIALKEEVAREKASVKRTARKTAIFTALVDEMRSSVKPLTPLPTGKPWTSAKGKISEHLVMHLSDEHADQIVLPEQVGDMEDYNFEVALARAEHYVDTTLKFTQETLKGQYTFPTLWILAYGDHTSGEIHGGESRSYYRNQFKNCLAIGQMHALMVRDLAPYFERVNVLYLPGNHGRKTMRKDFYGPQDNWDYLVGQVSKLYSLDLPNVSFMNPNSFSARLNINGHGFLVTHGEDIKSWSGIPWYGIERHSRRMVALHHAKDIRIKYFVCGHFHRAASISEMDGETIVNGPWLATDPYAYNALGAVSEPSQWIHGVHAKKGISWRIKVLLREGAKKSPDRYKKVLDTVE